MASSQETPVPPVPNQQDILEKVPGSNKVSIPWSQWFVQIRDKINVLNSSIVNLAGISGIGLLSKSGANWFLRTITGTSGRVNVADGDGAAGNPTIDLATSGVSAGSYTNSNITVDIYGRVIAASNGGSSIKYTQWNPKDKTSGFNLDVLGLIASESTSNIEGIRSTLGVTSGKYYCEILVTAGSTPFSCGIGLRRVDESISTAFNLGQTVFARSNGDTYVGSSGATAGTGSAFVSGSRLMLAFDADTGSVWIGVNSIWMNSGNPSAGTGALFTGLGMSLDWKVYFASDNNAATHSASASFGFSDFYYTVPTGFNPGWYS